MEHGAHAAHPNADPASGTLSDFGPSGAQQRLNFSPAQIGGGRFREDAPKGAAVTAIHALMIS